MSNKYKKLVDGFYVSGQITPDELQNISGCGIKALIINRPDGENPPRLHSGQIMQNAKAIGMKCVYIPVAGKISYDMIEQTRLVITDLPRPILAYCGSGKRSSILWCLANVQEKGIDDVLQCASDAGYDLSSIRPMLNAITGDR